MPLYTYKCPLCDDEEEFIMSINESSSEEHSPICKFCKYEKNVDIRMIKLLGNPIIQFTGGGWAKDNYNKPKSSNEEIK